MAVMVMVKLRSQSEYDAVARELVRRGVTSTALLSHVSAATDEGFLVVDIWPSRQDWEQFVRNELEPCMKAVPGIARPEVKIFEAYNVGWPGRMAEAEEQPQAH
ncbi:hypothetical protein NVS55_28500 [Myxococcus stipitatus]|uniref:hypothetical protein n=1 Tax=Myxococcus stipitatus TaxID=83455 RepID=UPI003145489C